MKKMFLENIKKSLEKEKENILARNADQDDIDFSGDEIDVIQGKILANISKELSTRDARKLKKIDLAFQKIKDKIYGACEDCDEAIAEKRLEANPYCTTCISCAELLEMEEAQRKRL